MLHITHVHATCIYMHKNTIHLGSHNLEVTMHAQKLDFLYKVSVLASVTSAHYAPQLQHTVSPGYTVSQVIWKSIYPSVCLCAVVDVCRTRSIRVPGALKGQHPSSDQHWTCNQLAVLSPVAFWSVILFSIMWHPLISSDVYIVPRSPLMSTPVALCYI